MCRLFGLSAGPQAVSARFWLLRAPDSLADQGAREPDGTGLGWYADGVAQVAKQPLAADADPAFTREARTIRSRTFVAHVRYATTGSLDTDNTHPFAIGDRLFAHNGVVQDLDALEHELGDAMSLVHGDTDSERVFALISREVDRRGGDIVAGVSAAVTWIAENLPLLSLNFVMIDAEDLWTLRYPDVHDLYVVQRGAGGGPLRHVASRRINAESDELAGHPAVAVATERMDEDPGWRQLPSGTLLHVDGRLGVREHRVIDHAPAHQLSLAELEGRARDAQSA